MPLKNHSMIPTTALPVSGSWVDGLPSSQPVTQAPRCFAYIIHLIRL